MSIHILTVNTVYSTAKTAGGHSSSFHEASSNVLVYSAQSVTHATYMSIHANHHVYHPYLQ